MAHFAYFAPFGVWPPNTVVPHGFLQKLDQDLFKAVNGDDGGTWAPSSVITIGGSGLSLSTPLSAAAATFSGKGTFLHTVWVGSGPSDIFQVFGTAVFDEQAGFNSGLTTTTLDAIGASTLAAVSCTSLTASTGVTSAALSVSGASTFSGAATIAGGASLTSDLALSGAGAIVERVVIGAAASGTYSASTADLIWLPATLTAGSYVYTIDHAAVSSGKRLRVALELGSSGTTSVDLLDIVTGRILPSSTTIKNAASNYTSVDLEYISGAWRMVAHSGVF